MANKRVLLAGQQNAGKSTIFNMLTGAKQHVANYPGVTVDKKAGYFSHENEKYQLIDLPGTYSLTSFSLEERVARKALLEEKADVVLNVMDASNIQRSLHLTLQLIELEQPLVLVLNMMDVAAAEKVKIDQDALSNALDIPVISCVGRINQGTKSIKSVLGQAKKTNYSVSYPKIESTLDSICQFIEQLSLSELPSLRWAALKLLEKDSEVLNLLANNTDSTSFEIFKNDLDAKLVDLSEELAMTVSDYIVAQRQKAVKQLIDASVIFESHSAKPSMSQRIDRVVLNKIGAPLFLVATVFIIYQCSIVYGYELTNYWWPYLASLREIIAGILPDAGFLYDPYVRSLGLWMVDSANTLLNYIPIFIILFALIAILEDSGYMARIAFISDRVLHKFGLHGQSTLPMILAGVFAGGCAVPGVMATKGIPDNRARLATILTVPYMNCLAKIPLYTLLLGIFFVEDKALMMFYISTISIISALLVAKLLTKTVLRKTETAPFVMELPRYNLPTARSVVTRSIERTWIYVKKVGTIVLAVSTIIFVLLQFPGVPEGEKQAFHDAANKAIQKFERSIAKTDYAESINEENLPSLVNYYTDFKRAKLNASGAEESKRVNVDFEKRNPDFYVLIAPPKGDKGAKVVSRALRKLTSERKKIRREMKERRLEASLLGSFGRSIEPVTQFAGFDWKINVALFSSFAARESSVATLGVLFQQDEDSNEKLEQRMESADGLSQHGEITAVALILFFILYPPCLATVMMIKVQTGEYKWMLLSIVLPTTLGFAVASTVFTIGTVFNLSGIQAMTAAYFTGLFLLLLLGFKDHLIRKRLPDEIEIKNI